MKTSHLNLKSLNFLWIFLALVPPLLMGWFLLKYSVNVPNYDDWDVANFIVKLNAGQFTIGDLWQLHNEHRIVFPVMITLLLAQLDNWNVVVGVFFNFVIMLLDLLILWQMVGRTVTSRLRPVVVVIVSLLLFSTVQFENLLWSFQVTWYLPTLCILLAIWAITTKPGKWTGFIIALVACLVATYSVASGMFSWAAVLVALLAQYRVWRLPRILIWIATAILSSAFYFFQYQQAADHPSLLLFIPYIWYVVLFLITYIGAPIGSFGGVKLSLILGLAVISAFVCAIFFLWQCHRKYSWDITRVLPWIMLAVFATLSASTTAVGRFTESLDYALVSRYSTVGLLIWIGVVPVVFMALVEKFALTGKSRQRLLAGVSGMAGLLLAVSYTCTYAGGIENLQKSNLQLESNLAAMYDYNQVAPDAIRYIFPYKVNFAARAQPLDELKYGPFHSPRPDYGPEWQAFFAGGQFQSYSYFSQKVTPLESSLASLQQAGDIISFSSNGKDRNWLHFDASSLYQNRKRTWTGGWEEQALDIQARNAAYVVVYWDIVNKFNWEDRRNMLFDEGYTAFKFSGADGWNHFKLTVPPNIKGFTISFYYTSDTLVNDQVKMDVYDKQ